MSRNYMDHQSRLCSSCSSLDFKSAFALSRTEIGRIGLAITATRRELQADCALCSCIAVRIFSGINTNDRVSAVEEIGYHFRALNSRLVSLRRFKHHLEVNSDIVVAVVRGNADQEPHGKQLFEAISLGLIVPLAHRSALQVSEMSGYHHYRGRIVNSLSPDFTRIRSWIDECHSLRYHANCKSLLKIMGFQTRVIDCWTRQIVPLTRDLEYLALSYVWGKEIDDENSQTSQTSGFVPFNAPQTIEDAMSVVQGLEERYLWVDRYCIWRSENRQLQIQNMHEIYRNALSTIVPVEADSAESGFSGVSSPRCDQFRFWTNAGFLIFTFPHISYHLSSSVWLTRGWTYQEAFLSRSCIFFTKDQVYFACRSVYQSEAVNQALLSLSDVDRETLEPSLLSYADYLDSWRRTLSPELFFYDHVMAYTNRSLTLDSDGLNAFEGIIKSRNTKSIWGIVSYCSNHSELGFAVGLAWSGARKPPGGGPVRRREGFPTWSWVSLVDQICHNLRGIGNRTPAGCSAYYVEDEHGQRIGIADIYKRTVGSGALLFSNLGKALFIEGSVTQVNLLWSKKPGFYSVHAPKSPFRSETCPSSWSLRVSEIMAWIDEEDAGLLSNIESHPWSAVQLFWRGRKEGSQIVRCEYWILVDERESVARRIGIIVPLDLGKGEIRMEDLETQRRLIRIE